MRGRVLVALFSVLLLSAQSGGVTHSTPDRADVSAAVGRGGRVGQAICLGCGMAILAAGGLTWGGLLVVSYFHADKVVACGYVCYDSFLR